MAAAAPDIETQCQDAEKDQGVALHLHKDNLSAATLNLKDEYVSAGLRLFVIHNVIRRNLSACSGNAKLVKGSNMDTFNFYANYTIFVLEDQLDAADTMWFPVFAHYDERFRQQIASHKMLRSKIEELKLLLPAKQKTESLQQSQEEELSDAFRDLHDIANQEFDREEALLNSLGHRVPIDEIRELERRQQERRRGAIRIYGHLWSAVYLLRSLNANERAIFPPAIPRVAVRGMLTVGSFQYRRELHWAPKL